MKALSLWEPRATLAVIGAKLYETRSWPTSHRGPLLIQATKPTPASRRSYHEQMERPETIRALKACGCWRPKPRPRAPLEECSQNQARDPWPVQGPTLVGTVEVVSCEVMTDELIARVHAQHPDEIAFGDWRWIVPEHVVSLLESVGVST